MTREELEAAGWEPMRLTSGGDVAGLWIDPKDGVIHNFEAARRAQERRSKDGGT